MLSTSPTTEQDNVAVLLSRKTIFSPTPERCWIEHIRYFLKNSCIGSHYPQSPHHQLLWNKGILTPHSTRLYWMLWQSPLLLRFSYVTPSVRFAPELKIQLYLKRIKSSEASEKAHDPRMLKACHIFFKISQAWLLGNWYESSTIIKSDGKSIVMSFSP